MIELSMGTDRRGLPIDAIPQSDTIATRVLTAGAAKTITVPASAGYVVFACNNDFYANTSGTAAVPSGDLDTGASELNPVVRKVASGSTISVISASNCILTASFYS